VVTRQQERYLKRQARKDANRKPVGKHVKPFRRAIALVEKIQGIVAKGLQPIARQIELDALPRYVSRGHGRPGLRQPSHNARAARSKYMPHQGARECDRRVLGGFYMLQRKHIASWA